MWDCAVVAFLAVVGFAQFELRVWVVGDAGQVGKEVDIDAVAVGLCAVFGEELDARFRCFGVRGVAVIFDVGAIFSQGECGLSVFFKYACEANLTFGGVVWYCAVDQGAIIFGCEVVPVQVFAYLCNLQSRIGFFDRGLYAREVCLIRCQCFLVRSKRTP